MAQADRRLFTVLHNQKSGGRQLAAVVQGLHNVKALYWQLYYSLHPPATGAGEHSVFSILSPQSWQAGGLASPQIPQSCWENIFPQSTLSSFPFISGQNWATHHLPAHLPRNHKITAWFLNKVGILSKKKKENGFWVGKKTLCHSLSQDCTHSHLPTPILSPKRVKPSAVSHCTEHFMWYTVCLLLHLQP